MAVTNSNESEHLLSDEGNNKHPPHDHCNERGTNSTTYPTSTSQSYGTCQNINGDVCDIPTPNRTISDMSQKEYSVTKVRMLLPLVLTLACMIISINSVIPQYLLDSYNNKSHHNTSHNEYSENSAALSANKGRGVCVRNASDPAVKKSDAIQAKVSLTIMYYSFAASFPALISCLIFGALVDIVGRRPAIISALLGFTCKSLLVTCIIKYNLDHNYFYLAYGLEGTGGSAYVLLISTFSMTADISGHKDSRILGIAILSVITSAMSAAGSIGIGLLIKKVGYVAASSAVLVPVALSLIVAFFILPETLPMQKQKPSIKRVWDYTTRIVFLYTRDGDKRKRMSLLFSLLIFFTSTLSNMNVGTIDTLFQRHEPLCWDAAQLGYYSAVRDAGVSIAGLVFLCISRFMGCGSDEVLSMIGMLFVAGSLVFEAFVTNTWQMYMVPLLAIPGVNVAPITRGVMSILAGPDKQGVMFSSVALIEVFSSLGASSAYNKIYAMTVEFMPGFVYLIMGAVAIVTFILYFPFFYFYDSPQKNSPTHVQVQDNSDASTTHSSTSSSHTEVI